MPDCTIILVNYRTAELSLAAIESVQRETQRAAVQIVAVDNASGDGFAEAVRERFPDVRLIEMDRNVGFGMANNVAAAEAEGEYLLLLNSDTVVLDGAVDRLLAFADAHPEAGIWGGRTVFADGSLNPSSCWRRPTPWSMFCQAAGLTAMFRSSRWFNPEAFGDWRRDCVRKVDIVSGCFFLIRRELWEQLDGFNPVFFMYGEEADLCLRARKLGARPMITPTATIVHYGGASERVRADKMVRLFKAKALLFHRHWRPTEAWFGVRMLDLWALSRAVALRAFTAVRRSAAEKAETWRSVWRRRSEWRGVDGGVETIEAVAQTMAQAAAEVDR